MPRRLLVLLGLCFFTAPLFAKDEPAKKKVDELQNGESIAAVDKAAVDAPLRRPADFPWVKLSDLKKVKIAKDKVELQVDYKVTEGTPQEVVVVFKALQGRKTRRWALAGEKEATVRFADIWPAIPEKVEAWIEYGGGLLTPSDTVVGYKISNSVLLGGKGQITSARHWKPEEEQAWNRQQLAKAPPGEPPAGYEFAEGKPLLPGMPVLTYIAGDWVEGEYVGTYQKSLIVIPPGTVPPMLHGATQMASRVAVAKRVIEQGQKSPEAFKPRVRVLPETLVPLTNDLTPIPDGVTILPGTPVRYGWGSQWYLVYAVGDIEAGQIETRDPRRGHHTSKQAVTSLAIEKSVLEDLQKPDAPAVFAKKYADLQKQWADERRRNAHVHDYPGTFPLPDGYGPLANNTIVKTGDKFFMNHHGDTWRTVTAVSDAPAGAPVEICWDHFTSWVEFVSRKSLFVSSVKNEAAKGDPMGPGDSKKPGGGYSLTLEAVTGKKFAVAKVVMDITGLDLADAKDAVDEVPILLSQSLTKGTAERFQKQLEAAGAKAAVRKVE